jgi:hypothetical protein
MAGGGGIAALLSYSNVKQPVVLALPYSTQPQHQDLVVASFKEGEQILHRLFLCTAGRSLWELFTPSAKKALLHELPGDVKTILALDSA